MKNVILKNASVGVTVIAETIIKTNAKIKILASVLKIVPAKAMSTNAVRAKVICLFFYQ